jgi:hypothetical protein
MQRREVLLLTGGVLTTATAGCLGPESSSESTPESPPDVEVEFTVENGDLVVTHVEGDVLQSGQTVYVTVAGETTTETTLSTGVHTGGEIIRVPDAEADYHQSHRVGLYLKQEGEPRELATGEVPFEHPAPNVHVDFDYNADTGVVEINALLSGECQLTVKGDNIEDKDVTWEAPVNGSGTSVILTGSIGSNETIATVSISSGEYLRLQWATTDGNYTVTLGAFEAP